jgi:hypothetical protein
MAQQAGKKRIVKVRGFVEVIRPDEVLGWAFRPDRPDDHLLIEIRCDDQKIAEARASSFRDDLLRAGIGKGDHAFVAKLSSGLSPTALLSATVVAVPSDGDPVLVPALRDVLVGPAGPRQTQILAGRIASSSPPLRELAVSVVDEQQRPVFILGAARSGTTALSFALLRTRYYEGFGEGHLMPLARALLLSCDSYYRENSAALQQDTLLRQVPQNLFELSIRSAFINMARSTFSGIHWLDKTPIVAMVHAAPLTREIWPNARYIFVRRRAVENIVSRMRRFPEKPFREHCSEWAAVMEAWLNVRPALSGASIEVDHLTLARDPAKTGKEVGDFLGLPHNVQDKFVYSLISDRPEQTSEGPTTVYRLDELGWPREDLEQFRIICGPMMKAYGYSFDGASTAATINRKG